METFSLAGRTAFVTGGSSGIGRAIVDLFTAKGARVGIGHYQRQDETAAFVADLSARGRSAAATECDVSCETSVARAKAWCDDQLGPVDILVNCAGIGGDRMFTEMSVAEWDRMIAVHLRGSFLITHAFFSGMVERKYGRIILTSSQLAYKGAPGLAHYCAAKAGIVGFVRALSYEGARHNVTVNGLAPGPVETEVLASLSEEWRAMKMAQLPVGRFGSVEEIAPAALLLASEFGGRNFCGQNLSPNGGDVML
ncbi:SDR family NAD(P)-dependent oxidoreductase [Methylobacterium brachythecii]|uniref:3-oxoacyl-ACP reductase n=1 Tax=Methylobacterium brachythecii TaxID=1176177 RepID=A0A7W6AM78_9HYPH|nr:SDR family NAD(P)-dependent oxidoreductase [Methylobacterium brachythecii]MBB3903690.1 3-oxoacyl-[acyl-carrier protein] reductase [Methylobacterium brachythecii]GLS44261.1 3-oxoacyl-ACP reductase [Methylobacterium brachythecii]